MKVAIFSLLPESSFKKIIISCIFLISCCFATYGQSIISGKLKNQEQRPLAYASIGLHLAKDSTLIKGSLSDSLGNFMFENIAVNQYIISVSSLSTQNKFLGAVNVKDSLQSYSLGNIVLQEAIKELDEIKITAKKPLLERRSDKLIFNLNSSTLAKGNSGFEVLRYIPTVKVYPDGGVSVMGKKGTLILIDNLQQHDTNNEALKSIRAESIERIEVYSNPPARYDAAGSSVINIIMKKDKMLSTIYQDLGSLFYPIKDIIGFQYASSYSGLTLYNNFGKLKTKTSLSNNVDNQMYSKSNESVIFKQTQATRTNIPISESMLSAYRVGISADYDFNDKNTALIEYSFRNRNLTFVSINDYKYFSKNKEKPDSTFFSENNSKSNGASKRLHLEFVHKINKKGQKFSMSYQNILSESDEQNNYSNLIKSNLNLSETNPVNQQKVDAFNINFDLPSEKGFQWELGSKYTILNYASTFDWFNFNKESIRIEDESFRNNFMFNESIWATFASTSKTIDKWQINAGLRNEYTTSLGNTDGIIIKNDYNNLFPSLFLQYAIADENTLGFSYSRRVQRPFYGEFNLKGIPFFNSPLNIIMGNKNLSPQFIHALEANYLFKNTSVALSLNRTNARRVSIPVEIQGNRIISQILNLAYSENFALALNRPFQITKWWQMNNGLNLYFHQSKLLDNSIMKGKYWDYNMMQTFTLSKKASIETSFQFYSGEIEQYTSSGPMKQFDISYKNSFLKNKLDVGVGFTDAFGIMKYINYSETPLTSEAFKSISNQRSIRLSLAYKFPTTTKFQKKSGKMNDFGEVRVKQ